MRGRRREDGVGRLDTTQRNGTVAPAQYSNRPPGPAARQEFRAEWPGNRETLARRCDRGQVSADRSIEMRPRLVDLGGDRFDRRWPSLLSQETLEQYRRMTIGERLDLTFEMMRENTPYLLRGTEGVVSRRFELIERENDLRNERILAALSRLQKFIPREVV
jgi:hypothetical protein